MKKILLFITVIVMLQSCENYSNGERIGFITQFSKTGAIFKSYEGHLNVTQTGMNSSIPFDFSIDNDRESPELVSTIDSAAQYGWKVKLVYHKTLFKNVFHNRGHTYHFVSKVEVLDRNFENKFSNKQDSTTVFSSGRIVDTIYVVIDKSK